MLDLARRDDLAHQFRRRRIQRKIRQHRRKPRRPQNPQRIFGERRRHMPQPLAPQIAAPVERIDHLAASLVQSDGVNRQIAPRQILLERHLRRGMKNKAAIAAPDFALGARERVFVARARIDKHRKIRPDRAQPARRHLLRSRPHRDIIALARFAPQQAVAHRAADEIDFHRRRAGGEAA